MVSSICLFEITNVVVRCANSERCPGSSVFFCIDASAADVANSDGIKRLLATDTSTFFINEKSFFINEPKVIPKNPPSCLTFLSVVPFNKNYLFFKKLIYFIISFISWFVSAIAELPVVGDFL